MRCLNKHNTFYFALRIREQIPEQMPISLDSFNLIIIFYKSSIDVYLQRYEHVGQGILKFILLVDIPFKWLHQKSCLIPIRLNPVIFSVTKFSHPLFHKILKFKVSSFSFSVEPSIERFPQLEEVRSPYRDGVRMDADSFVKRWSAPAADSIRRDAFSPYTLHHETVYLMKMKSKFELH